MNGALERGTDLRVYLGDTLTYLRALMLLRYGANVPCRAELPDEELGWLEEQVTAWEAGQVRRLVGGFGDALASLRDPAQLLIQVELVVVGGWTRAVGEPSDGRAGACLRRVTAREGPGRAPVNFTAGPRRCPDGPLQRQPRAPPPTRWQPGRRASGRDGATASAPVAVPAGAPPASRPSPTGLPRLPRLAGPAALRPAADSNDGWPDSDPCPLGRW